MTELNAGDVIRIAQACMEPDGAITSAVCIEGVVSKAHFQKVKLMEYRSEIVAMLDELPIEFRSQALGGGGGWTFLNACNDRNGRQWTGMHQVMEMLFMLGMGIGCVGCLLPRELWDMLPGGMPYYVINAQGDDAEIESPDGEVAQKLRGMREHGITGEDIQHFGTALHDIESLDE